MNTYNFTEAVQKLLNAYRTHCDDKGQEIKDTLAPYAIPAYCNRFTAEGLRLTIREQMKTIMEDWKQYDTLLNQKLKVLVENINTQVKKDLHIGEMQKGTDYPTRVANAREFLKMELTTENDSLALNPSPDEISKLDTMMYFILQDFVNDFNTMKLFAHMVEKMILKKKVPSFVDAEGTCIFPKTFGTYCKYASIMNVLAELAADAETLFLYKRIDGEVIRYKGFAYAVPMDTYDEVAGERTIIANATILDSLMEKVNTEGQSHTSMGLAEKQIELD